MTERLEPGDKRPGLFRQITVRLAIFALVFALVDIGIVVYTYLSQPQTLAQELLDLEVSRIDPGSIHTYSERSDASNSFRWTYTLVEPLPVGVGATSGPGNARLIDWTKREQIPGGYLITGLRSLERDGKEFWIRLEFEGHGLRPFAEVIGREIIQHVALPLVPLSLLLLLFNALAVRSVLKPLFEAEQQALEMDPGIPGQRLSVKSAPREITTLVQALNGAFERLDKSVSTLKDFTGFAAHELRTPLSIMLLTAGKLPPGEVRQQLSDDIRSMSRLVAQLLELAQAEALVLADPPIVNLAEIGKAVVGSLEDVARAANQTLVFHDFGNSDALAHSEAVSRIFRNLIDNAIAHAPSDRPIEVSAGPGPRLSVRDFGPGIANSDRTNVFKKFWQGGTRSEGGAGLGLGIVKRLVDALNGEVTLELPEGGGTSFSVSFRSVDLK
ncbi:MAG: HAMP domain-containing histidine kinase [Hyphomonas sp.]|uniref:sensor histidine kinase n=1 Tax=Hyphomonas sp. TaxID=87 RepID=UPI0017F4E82D|nr:HAMP domain-containing sensor histidine kinase [Hyphomonas sp.]MBA3069238.1 HAMP domain-containing histidine kinase [Hyphomonas sp.]MBU3919322.1 HAMP domain-containing histidine kinase [Alphaproteobacteria bacterium]MBU4061815.1 HAMP domain-containing histidine kinase [Alphaproteobacteria bacterium]MBU4163353.1 HAMP domain-containing histidine kinase [Alphaproteobacteria bacterium]